MLPNKKKTPTSQTFAIDRLINALLKYFLRATPRFIKLNLPIEPPESKKEKYYDERVKKKE